MVPDVVGAAAEDRADHREREDAHRHVDVEDPAPGEVVDEEAAEQRADHRREPEDRAEVALVAAPLARRDDVPDHGHRRHHQAATTQSLDGTECDELKHVAADAA